MKTREEVISLLDRLHSAEVSQVDNDHWFALVSRFQQDWGLLDELAYYHSIKDIDKVTELLPAVEQKLREYQEPLFSVLENEAES